MEKRITLASRDLPKGPLAQKCLRISQAVRCCQPKSNHFDGLQNTLSPPASSSLPETPMSYPQIIPYPKAMVVSINNFQPGISEYFVSLNTEVHFPHMDPLLCTFRSVDELSLFSEPTFLPGFSNLIYSSEEKAQQTLVGFCFLLFCFLAPSSFPSLGITSLAQSHHCLVGQCHPNQGQKVIQLVDKL